jgi:hypothetical protein
MQNWREGYVRARSVQDKRISRSPTLSGGYASGTDRTGRVFLFSMRSMTRARYMAYWLFCLLKT